MFLRNRDPTQQGDVETEYVSMLNRNRVRIIIIAVLAFVAAFGSLFVSQIDSMTPQHVLTVLRSHLFGGETAEKVYDLVVWNYNVPRALLGLAVGSSLAVGGAIMQSILRNPLATPYTTGVSAGASMGASLYIYLNIALIPTGGYISSIAINSIVFALIPTAAILLVSRQKHITPTTMILAGIAIMYIFSAGTSLLMLIMDPENVQQAYEWGVGSLGRGSWDNVWYVILSVVPCIFILQLLSKQVNMMNSGNRSAQSMGVDVRLIRNISLIVIALMTAVTVSITGGIGFMGLVAPHISRMIVGSDLKYLLPCSAALGALILLVSDTVCRIVVPEGIPVGVITAVIGGPIFVLLLVKGSKKVWF